MQADKQVLAYLNQVLVNELTAINQYFMHAKMCEHWGLARLAESHRKGSFGEMRHAERLMERVLFLEGLPNLQDLHKVNVGEDVPEQLTLDLELERHAVPVLREAIGYCREQRDDVSKALFQSILDDEEEHIDWLETQLELVDKVGIQNYLQSQI